MSGTCPVTGSLVFPGSIGPGLTLHVPFPGMLLCVCGACVWVWDCVAVHDGCEGCVFHPAECGFSKDVQKCGSYLSPDSLARWGVSGLTLLLWTNDLRPHCGDYTLEAGRGAGSKSFNRGGRVLSVRNVDN